MPFLVTNGEPGDRWQNDTGKVLYQLRVQWSNSCGLCAQYDHAIGTSWPIPFHHGCNCVQAIVLPGATAAPFVDFREEVARLDEPQRNRVVGASNYRLIQRGLAEWSDVVTQSRIRDFREVVSLKRLSVKDMAGIGINKRTAEDAYSTVHTAAHSAADESRRRIIEALRTRGYNDAAIKHAVGQRLAGRVSTSPGPLPPPPPAPPAPAVPPRPKPPAAPKPAPVVAKPPPKPVRPVGPAPLPAMPAEIEKAFKVRLTPEAHAKAKAEIAAKKVTPKGPPNFDPTLPAYKKQVQSLQPVIDVAAARMGRKHKLSAEAYKVEATKVLARALDLADPYIRVPDQDTLLSILDDGRFKSQFETGTSSGAFNHTLRSQVEASVGGISPSVEDKKRPIYGYLGAPDFRGAGGIPERDVRSYGSVVVKLKSTVKQSATFTIGDSLNLRHDVAASPISDPSLASVPFIVRKKPAIEQADPIGATQRYPDDPIHGFSSMFAYVEAQYHGGLGITEIAEIAFNSEPHESVTIKLRALGIPFRVTRTR